MGKFFHDLHEKLINELEFDRADLDRELSSWILRNGGEKESVFKFYKVCMELGESHFSGEKFADLEQNPGLRTVYSLMFQLFVEADWSRTPVTEKLNRLNMVEASRRNFKMDMEIIPPNRCEYSEQFRDRLFDLESAIKEFPLDYSKCQREGGCVCTVGFEGVRDQDGRLVRKGN